MYQRSSMAAKSRRLIGWTGHSGKRGNRGRMRRREGEGGGRIARTVAEKRL
jgi:hypothetical protein